MSSIQSAPPVSESSSRADGFRLPVSCAVEPAEKPGDNDQSEEQSVQQAAVTVESGHGWYRAKSMLRAMVARRAARVNGIRAQIAKR